MFTSKCPLKVQIFLGLSPFFQIELLKTGRFPPTSQRLLLRSPKADLGGSGVGRADGERGLVEAVHEGGLALRGNCQYP